MTSPDTLAYEFLDDMKGELIVVDTDAHLLYIGRLEQWNREWIELSDVDVHDHRSNESTKEKYIHQARKLGHHSNRQKAYVLMNRVFSFSRLDDVLKF